MKKFKWSRIRKLTWKLVLVYALIMVLVAFADPDPRAWHFWVGIGLIVVGELFRIWAAGHLLKNKRLTTTGPYAFVKNPLYVGTFLIMVGFCIIAQGADNGHWTLNNINWFLLALGVLVFAAYYVPYKKKREGDRLRNNFGEDWEVYDENVPDYLPRLSRWTHPNGQRVNWTFRAVCENSEQWTPLSITVGIVAILFSPEIMDFVQRTVG